MAPAEDRGHLSDAAQRADRRFEAIARRADEGVQSAGRDAAALLGRHPRASRVSQLARAVLDRQSEERLGLAASGAAFWLVISAFPTAAAVVSLFGLVVTPTQVANDLSNLTRGAPASFGSLITHQLQHVAASDRDQLSIGLGVSVVLAVWSASAGLYNIDRAVRYAFGLPRQRYLDARARAVGGALVAVVVLGAMALLTSVVGANAPTIVVAAVAVPSALVALTVAIATLYRFSIGPSVHARQLFPGAVFAAATVLVSLVGLSIYLALSADFVAIYGAFAGAVVGMVGTYLAAYALLLGAVVNAELIHPPASGTSAGTGTSRR
ncbi:MAG: YihY/virulence factor BrkB family protein [Acidimicrobiales bacterium]